MIKKKTVSQKKAVKPIKKITAKTAKKTVSAVKKVVAKGVQKTTTLKKQASKLATKIEKKWDALAPERKKAVKATKKFVNEAGDVAEDIFEKAVLFGVEVGKGIKKGIKEAQKKPGSKK